MNDPDWRHLCFLFADLVAKTALIPGEATINILAEEAVKLKALAEKWPGK